jgi:hypothetical protein
LLPAGLRIRFPVRWQSRGRVAQQELGKWCYPSLLCQVHLFLLGHQNRLICTNDEYGGPGRSPSDQRARNFAVAAAQTRCVSREVVEKSVKDLRICISRARFSRPDSFFEAKIIKLYYQD